MFASRPRAESNDAAASPRASLSANAWFPGANIRVGESEPYHASTLTSYPISDTRIGAASTRRSRKRADPLVALATWTNAMAASVPNASAFLKWSHGEIPTSRPSRPRCHGRRCDRSRSSSAPSSRAAVTRSGKMRPSRPRKNGEKPSAAAARNAKRLSPVNRRVQKNVRTSTAAATTTIVSFAPSTSSARTAGTRTAAKPMPWDGYQWRLESLKIVPLTCGSIEYG